MIVKADRSSINRFVEQLMVTRNNLSLQFGSLISPIFIWDEQSSSISISIVFGEVLDIVSKTQRFALNIKFDEEDRIVTVVVIDKVLSTERFVRSYAPLFLHNEAL